MEILRFHKLPSLLKQIHTPPQRLYLLGASLSEPAVHVAIVGTRLASRYGLNMAYKIARAASEAGGVVVSGLAFGIDAQVHKAAVDLGRPTIAVLASGVQRVTPWSHSGLAQKIVASGGTLLSEYELFDSAHKYRFLERNRLISGLCKATIVIEAKERSGALITARHAFDQNRDVYALVGDIDRPQARGCLNLIRKDIARPIVSIDALLEDLGLNLREARRKSLPKKESSLLHLLDKEPLSLQDLVERTNNPVSKINATLSTLEVQNLIQKNPAGKWESTR